VVKVARTSRVSSGDGGVEGVGNLAHFMHNTIKGSSNRSRGLTGWAPSGPLTLITAGVYRVNKRFSKPVPARFRGPKLFLTFLRLRVFRPTFTSFYRPNSNFLLIIFIICYTLKAWPTTKYKTQEIVLIKFYRPKREKVPTEIRILNIFKSI